MLLCVLIYSFKENSRQIVQEKSNIKNQMMTRILIGNVNYYILLCILYK